VRVGLGPFSLLGVSDMGLTTLSFLPWVPASLQFSGLGDSAMPDVLQDLGH
jgi:hypothetical protein